MTVLLLKKKAEIIREYIIAKTPVMIGNSEENDIHIDDKSLSTHHCSISLENSAFSIQDNNSAFGTYVNQEKITLKNIQFGDHIKLGNSHYSLILIPEEQELDPSKKSIPFIHVLAAIQGKFAGKLYELYSPEVRIGRDEDYNDIVLSGKIDPSVSRRHSTIHNDGHSYIITDRRSRNRTFVNQTQLGEEDSIQLHIGDELVIGHTIFRLCTFDKIDFSSPKKASIFIERIKIPLLHVISAVAGLISVGILFVGIRGCMILNDVEDIPAIEISDWSAHILSDDPKPVLPEIYDVTLSPAVGNITGSGSIDIVAAFPYGKLYAWNAEHDEVVWETPYDIKAAIDASPTLYDVNGDNAVDIVIAGGDSRIHIIDGITGKLMYKSPLLGGSLSGAPAVGDINNDSIPDIICCSKEGTVHFLYNPLIKPDIKSAKVSSEILSAPVLYKDINENLVIVPAAEGKIYIYNGESRESRTIDTVESINKFIGSNLPINELTSAPAIGDINGNDRLDIVSLSNQYYVTAINAATRELEWIYHIEPPSIKEPPDHFSSPVLADLDADSLPDVILTSCNGRIIALKGTTGELLWEYIIGDWNRIISSPALVDLNKDGILDIICGSEDGYVYGLNGSYQLDPDADRLFFKQKSDATPITSTPCIADIDRDGYTDIVVSYSDTKLKIFRTNNRVFRNSVFFPMVNFNASHQGNVKSIDHKPAVIYYIAGSCTMLAVIFLLNILVRRKLSIFKPKRILLQTQE
ncbi:MAG: FHA domain-containing protein [bacterium]